MMSKRISLKLSELKPNPYKKFIQNGEVDDLVVAQIMESATRTSLWEQWVVRETPSGYQLAFGHNRLAAAKKVLGQDATVNVQLEPYSDEQMFIAMADENAGEQESIPHQVDVVRKAKQLLISNPAWCKWLEGDVPERDGTSKFARHDNQHMHGSVECILAFLGEKNWSHTQVGNLYKLAENADPSVLNVTVSRDDLRHPKQGQIGREAAMSLSGLSKQTQRAAVEAIHKAEVQISSHAIKAAVEEVENMPPSRQEAGIKRALQRKAETQRIAELQRKRKQESRGNPKARKEVPHVRQLMVLWAAQIGAITKDIADLKPHKETINKDANFTHLDKKVTELADLMNELRIAKPKPQAMRTAHEELKQLN